MEGQGRALEPYGVATRGKKAWRRLGQEGPRGKTRREPVLADWLENDRLWWVGMEEEFWGLAQ